MVEIQDLGPLRVDGVAIEDKVPSPIQRELFACLVSAYPVAVSTDRLLEILWPGQRPRPRLVWTHVSRLRACLADLHDLEIETVGGGYRLGGQVRADRGQFEAMVRAEREHSESEDSSRRGWEQALALWRGEFLEGFDAERFSPGRRERLSELHVEATLGSARRRLNGPDLVGVLTELEDLAVEHPYRESVIELLPSRCTVLVAGPRACRDFTGSERSWPRTPGSRQGHRWRRSSGRFWSTTRLCRRCI